MYLRPEPLILSVDIGSSSVKGFAFDPYGEALGGIEGRAPCTLQYSPDGGAEVDLPCIVRAVDGVLDALHARSGGREVLGVAMTSIASSLVALGEGGRPLAPVLSYADTRSRTQLGAMPADVARVERTGCPDYTAYWPAQIRWWRARQAASPPPTAWCSVADALQERWFGGPLRTSYSLASWTGCLNRQTLAWDGPVLDGLGLSPSQLPELAEHSAPHVGLRPEYARRWPKFARIPFFPAVGDGAAANVGSGATGPGQIALTVGSTSAMRTVVPLRAPAVPPGLWAYLVSGERALVGGALTEGGNLHQWLRDSLQLGSWTDLEPRLAALAPDGHGLTFIPSLGGARSPDYNPDATGTLHGLKFSTTPTEMLRAAMEGVAYRLADIAVRLNSTLDTSPLYVASGKALLSSDVWLGLLADVLGAPVVVTDFPDEASARGAARLALGALDLLDPYAPSRRPRSTVYEPRPEAREVYGAARERQQRLMTALSALPG
ncbi:gluconokinase [Deinococcus hopiensis]|uniref:Gluconokinase n=1 Tax=Deinococcus hopiensis KR-140 TaxID=695939 RepID=A0A1W1UFP5_9DEIO|nr:gluconokinase [Deinococcus hopiensis]SMB79925.1 gluconokinase [Deinococcus hopiensis KR-140]